MFESLFTFPTVMVDGDLEDLKKENKSTYTNRYDTKDDYPEVDIIIGEACVNYYEFIGIADRWLPKESSYDNALRKKFDACIVYFNTGQYICPLPKEEFMARLKEFAVTVEQKKPKVKMVQINSKEDLQKFLQDETNDIEDENPT